MKRNLVQMVICGLLCGLVLPSGVAAKSCAAMQKQLAELRVEYHEYAVAIRDKGEGVKFDKLTEILDKIVELKRAMTEADCKTPPRKKQLGTKK